MRGAFFNPDLRTVALDGVEQVMKHFFRVHQLDNRKIDNEEDEEEHTDIETVCEEMLQDQGAEG
ncbi:MAG: hypothetical protein C0618_00800 [Desulfuromonas sp.]|nr:MAG: hypothetical protein C0618_00800 [Desulfuromonas sp.]